MTAPAAVPHLAGLSDRIDAMPGTVSVYCGRLGSPPAYTRLADATHYAASTMKVAVLVAMYRAAEEGRLDLDREVPVHDNFPSVLPGGGRFVMRQSYDNDDEVWARMRAGAPARWLARRMIVRSSNLATNLCLEQVGVAAVEQVLRDVGARHSTVSRGIEDAAAREAGLDNLVTAADLAALLGAIALGVDGLTAPRADGGATSLRPVAASAACREMLEVLSAQEHREDIAAGLPADVRIAHKNGWVTGVRHGAGVIFPADAPPYLLVCCTTTPAADATDEGSAIDRAACALLADIAAASWADRHDL